MILHRESGCLLVLTEIWAFVAYLGVQEPGIHHEIGYPCICLIMKKFGHKIAEVEIAWEAQ